MNRLLARLERTFLGKLAVQRLITFIVGGMAIVFVLGTARESFVPLLDLQPALLRAQPWRVATFLFLPDSWSPIFVIFSLYFTYLIGNALEEQWGAFKLNAYYFVGVVGTVGAAFVTGRPQTNLWLNISLYFAFATLFPDYVIRLFLFVPVKVKWVALVGAAGIIYQFVEGDLGLKTAIGVSFANYLLFFGAHLVGLAKSRRMLVRQSARRAAHRASVPERADPNVRACAMCGLRQDEGADIRVCSCERCGGVSRTLCLEHARRH